MAGCDVIVLLRPDGTADRDGAQRVSSLCLAVAGGRRQIFDTTSDVGMAHHCMDYLDQDLGTIQLED